MWTMQDFERNPTMLTMQDFEVLPAVWIAKKKTEAAIAGVYFPERPLACVSPSMGVRSLVFPLYGRPPSCVSPSMGVRPLVFPPLWASACLYSSLGAWALQCGRIIVIT
jgi:hypothetical protein